MAAYSASQTRVGGTGGAPQIVIGAHDFEYHIDQFVVTVQDPSCMKKLSPGSSWWDLGKNKKNKVGLSLLPIRLD